MKKLMMTIAATSLLVVSGIAAATTYGPYSTPAWPLKLTAEPAMMAIAVAGDYWESTWIVEKCEPGSWTGGACPHYGEQAEWNSDWSYVKCYTVHQSSPDRQVYGLHFRALKGAWPSSTEWAAHTSVTCSRTEGGNTVSVVVPITTQPDSNGSGSTPSTLATLGTTVTLTLTGDEGMDYDLKIPPAGTYISGAVSCVKTGGAAWPDVTAFVYEIGTTDYIKFTTHWQPGAPNTITGTCPVSRNGTINNVPVTVVQN